MVRNIARRLLSLVLISIAIIFFSTLGMHMIDNWQPVSLEPVAESGYNLLDDSRAAATDTVAFIGNLLRGDLGDAPTVSGPRPVAEILSEGGRNSAGILLLALGGATLVSLFLGMMAALSRRGAREYTVLLGTIVGISAPSFLIALLLQQGGILYTRNTGTRLVSMGGFAWDFQHLAMPLIVLAARPVATLTRASYLAMVRIMAEDYIRTAYAKGLPQRRVVLGHALRNFAVPFLTSVGVSLRFSLSTLPLVEYIFAWPGLGLRILEAIQQRAPILVVSIALALGLAIQLVDLLLGVAYSLIDPRIGARN